MSESSPKPLFDLTPDEDQALMRETVRKFVQVEIKDKARAADEAGAAPEGFYGRVQELGFNAVCIPEDYGGLGADRSPVSNTLIAEDLAYGDLSLALGSMSALSFVNTVIDQGSDAQKARYLPQFADDEFRPAALAFLEPGAGCNAAKPAMAAVKDGDAYVLNGQKAMVPFGADAEFILVSAQVEGEGVCAFVLDKGTGGLTGEATSHMGLRSLQLATLTLKDVRIPSAQKLGEGERTFDIQRVLSLARIGLSALTVGTCNAVLDYVKEYCSDRVAFGEPITNRQSVAFMIADIAIELDGLRLMTYRAASRAEQGLPFEKEAYLAKLQASEKGMKIGTDGVQLLGGHGFIRDHMVELYYRNLRSIGILEGAICV